ncbi:MATE family efflux transporter [Paenibacillus glycanilyticus]|uniref:MATE family efflux transporter n=1 Tax=Paenibacillus glycanilyticus TaxID=126569 RepID=UPI002040B152|nr:MATE family efflux transporter [Paenibacillus glycanilyticus]MCM3631236.1 MATE family efflux transporter [Paenibacillus glycanilyticus]
MQASTDLNSEFRNSMMRLVVPSVLQMLVGNSFSLLNTLMVGRLGDTAIAVVAAVGQIGFVLSMILTGVYGIAAFITQFHGKGDKASLQQAFGLMLISSVAVTLVLVAGVFAFKSSILKAFINDPGAVAYGAHYLTVLLLVYLINSIKDAYGHALGAIGQIKATLVVGLIAMSVNGALDYALIYGRLGLPEYGIAGAAWATLASSIIGGIMLIAYVYARKVSFHIRFKTLMSLKFSFVKKLYATTLPLVFHEGLWSVGNMLYAVAFGYMGVTALATFQLARTFNGYFMMGIFGFAYAANVLIGQKLSQKEPEEAIIYARKFTGLTIIVSIVASLAIAALSPYIVMLFSHTSEEVRTAFKHVMLIQSVLMTAYFLNNLWIVGMFRAGGDNVYTLKLIFVTTWLIALPLVFAGAYFFHWPIERVYFLFALEEVSKACIGYFRYRSNKWANNLTQSISERERAA